jgi:hypothetical protein
MRYSEQAKELFWKYLAEYRQALKAGTDTDIVAWSLRIHGALADVPKHYAKYVRWTYRDTQRVVYLGEATGAQEGAIA